jgi:hypothetical protein
MLYSLVTEKASWNKLPISQSTYWKLQYNYSITQPKALMWNNFVLNSKVLVSKSRILTPWRKGCSSSSINYSPPSNAEVKNAWKYISFLHISPWSVHMSGVSCSFPYHTICWFNHESYRIPMKKRRNVIFIFYLFNGKVMFLSFNNIINILIYKFWNS